MLKVVRTKNPERSSHGGDSDQDKQEILDHQEGDDHNYDEDEKCASGADEEKEGDDLNTTMLGDCYPAIASSPPTIKDKMHAMFLRLLFSQMVVKKLVENQGIDSSRSLASLSENDITAICDVIKMPYGSVSGRMLKG